MRVNFAKLVKRFWGARYAFVTLYVTGVRC